MIRIARYAALPGCSADEALNAALLTKEATMSLLWHYIIANTGHVDETDHTEREHPEHEACAQRQAGHGYAPSSSM